MSDTNQISQTEGSNLAIAEETVSGQSPTSGWYNFQINSYSKIGASIKKTPRDPISQSLQLQKGMPTDEDSGMSFDVDVTKHHLDRLAKHMTRSVPKHSGPTGMSTFQILGVTSTGFTVAALGAFPARFLVVSRGLNTDADNGLFLVTSGSIGTETHAAGLVVEASPPSNAELELAGYRGVASDIFFDSDGNLNNSGGIDFTTFNLQDNQFVVIGGEDTVNQFATAVFNGSARVAKNGVTARKIILEHRSWVVEQDATLDLQTETTNVDTVVEARTPGAGGNAVTLTFVADGTPAVKAHLALATAHIDTVVRAKAPGAAGNLITIEIVAGAPTAAGVLTEVGTHVKLQYKASSTATTVTNLETLIATSTLIEVMTPGTGANILDATDATASRALASGTDATAVSVTEVSTAVTVHFTGGASTVLQIETRINADSTQLQVKTPGTPSNIAEDTVDEFGPANMIDGTSGADSGTGKQIDIYFTRYFRNVARNHGDFVKSTLSGEMTYEDVSDAGGPEYEYMLGNGIDETVLNVPVTSKATMTFTMMGMQTPNPTATRKTGPDSAKDANTNTGVSTSTDIARIRIDDIDDVGISTDFENAKISIKNNITPQKQIGTLGSTKMINGQCALTCDLTIIFTTTEAIKAVRDNRTCHMDILMRNPDFGMMLDVHSMTLDTADKKLEKNKAITLGVKTTGFQDAKSGSTFGLSMFAWLPQPPDSSE